VVANDQATDITLFDQFLGALDEFASGDLDLFGPGVLFS